MISPKKIAIIFIILISLLLIGGGVTWLIVITNNCKNPKPNQNCDPNTLLENKISSYFCIAAGVILPVLFYLKMQKEF